jgi:hypothetical protein
LETGVDLVALDEIAYSQRQAKEVPLLSTLLFVSLLSCGLGAFLMELFALFCWW